MKLTLSLLVLFSIIVSVLSTSIKRSLDTDFPDSRFQMDDDFPIVRRCLSLSCAVYRKLRLGSGRGTRKSRYGNYRKLYSSRRKGGRVRDTISGIDRRAFENFLAKTFQNQEK